MRDFLPFAFCALHPPFHRLGGLDGVCVDSLTVTCIMFAGARTKDNARPTVMGKKLRTTRGQPGRKPEEAEAFAAMMASTFEPPTPLRTVFPSHQLANILTRYPSGQFVQRARTKRAFAGQSKNSIRAQGGQTLFFFAYAKVYARGRAKAPSWWVCMSGCDWKPRSTD